MNFSFANLVDEILINREAHGMPLKPFTRTMDPSSVYARLVRTSIR